MSLQSLLHLQDWFNLRKTEKLRACKMSTTQATTAPIQTTQIAIIGSGFGGLAMAIRLIQAYVHDFIIIKKKKNIKNN